MRLSEAVKAAYRKLLEREHLNILSLSRKTGVNYATANRLAQPKADFGNIPLATIERLFPEMKIYFFRDEYPSLFRRNSVEIGGNMNGEIAQESNIRRNTDAAGQIDLRQFRLKLKKSNKFSTEERLKILDFLDEDLQ